jgi:uncharacterized protein YbjQ (UPF0145 family)
MGLFSKDEFFSMTKDLYTGSVVPGYTIDSVLGTVQFSKNKIESKVLDDVDFMLETLVSSAKGKGADAVVNFKISSGTYDRGGNYATSYIIVYGEAVTLKYEG